MPSCHQSSRQRIISLAPSVTSILVALGARRQLVAVSKWCKDVADVDGLPVMGDCWALSSNPSRDASGKTAGKPSGKTTSSGTASSSETAGSNDADSGASNSAVALLELKPTLIIGSVPF